MRRRRKQKRRRLYLTIIASLVVVVLIGVGVFFGVRALKHWKAANEANSQSQIEDYTGSGDKEVTFTVESGQGPAEIAENLVKAKIVKSAAAFTSAVSGASATLYPGSYALKTHMKASDVVKILSDQSKAGGFAEVKAGERVSDVIANAAQASGIDVSEFQAIIDGGGSGILPEEAGGKFEGWLEPGAYNAQNKSAKDIIKSMVDARIAKLDDLGVPTGSERESILIIASIAESEVGSDRYYGQVARVILNRIDSDMALGMDTTVAYGLGISASRLTDDQLNDDSNPYNTRIHKGLTPTPISNPGDDAIKASINPPEGKWMYFVTTNLQTGETKFVETEDEFWKIRDEYKNNNENAN
nr:endolytic transglycosylase MltG [Bifidobacterium sp. M3-R-103]